MFAAQLGVVDGGAGMAREQVEQRELAREQRQPATVTGGGARDAIQVERADGDRGGGGEQAARAERHQRIRSARDIVGAGQQRGVFLRLVAGDREHPRGGTATCVVQRAGVDDHDSGVGGIAQQHAQRPERGGQRGPVYEHAHRHRGGN